MNQKTLSKFRGRVNESGDVLLSFYLATEMFKKAQDGMPLCIRIWRKETPGFVFNRDYEEYFDGILIEGAKVIFEGSLPAINQRKFEYVDQTANTGCTYAYWVSIDEHPVGPVVLKVRDREVWWPYEVLQKRLCKLAEQYPDVVDVQNYMHTTQKRPIPGIQVGNQKRRIAFIGAIHAGESGPELIVPILEKLVMNHPKELSQVGVVAIPSVNIDERERQVQGTPWYLRTNSNRVDLNRNFPAEWETVGYEYGLISSDPDAMTYRGPFPASEDETRAVMQFMEQVQPLGVFSFHCLASICSPVFLTSKFAREDILFAEKCRALLEPYTNGFYGTAKEVALKYASSAGSLSHWLYESTNTPCFDLEWDGDEKTKGCITDLTTPEMLNACMEGHYRGVVNVLKSLAGS